VDLVDAALDNHTLKDLGIDRSEILPVAYGDDRDRLRRSVHD
jgi:Domain of unknown function (DUF1127)